MGMCSNLADNWEGDYLELKDEPRLGAAIREMSECVWLCCGFRGAVSFVCACASAMQPSHDTPLPISSFFSHSSVRSRAQLGRGRGDPVLQRGPARVARHVDAQSDGHGQPGKACSGADVGGTVRTGYATEQEDPLEGAAHGNWLCVAEHTRQLGVFDQLP